MMTSFGCCLRFQWGSFYSKMNHFSRTRDSTNFHLLLLFIRNKNKDKENRQWVIGCLKNFAYCAIELHLPTEYRVNTSSPYHTWNIINVLKIHYIIWLGWGLNIFTKVSLIIPRNLIFRISSGISKKNF